MAQYYFEPLSADNGSPPSNAVFVQPWSASSFSSILVTATPSVAFTPAATTITNSLAAFSEIESVDVSAVKPTQIYGMIWPRASSNSFFIAACCTGSGFDAANGYYVGVNRSSGNLELRKVSGGTRTLLDSVAGAENADFHVLLDITESGGDVILQAKVWQDGSAEPGSPTLSYTDTSPIALTGYVGLTQTNRTASLSPELYRLGIGTGGDPAPRSSGGSTAVNFSGTVPTQNLTEGAAMTPLDLSTYFSGTETPFSYAVQSGTLPDGLSLNTSTGVISGTPTTAGTASIVVRATDQTPDTADTNSFDIVVTGGGDVTAPTLSAPIGTQTGQTTAALSVSTDENNGTLYWVVSESATPPSVAQIQAGNDSTGSAAADSGSQAVSATGTQNINATGLSAGTTYYAYFQHTDAASNDSTVAASSSFTTASLASVTVTDPLKNNTGTLHASETGIKVSVLDATTLASVYETTGLTTNASGVLEAISNAAITASNSYHVAIKLADGSVGITGPITAT